MTILVSRLMSAFHPLRTLHIRAKLTRTTGIANVDEMQVEAVLALDGPQRVEHLIKTIADKEQAWGLYGGSGWASSATESGDSAFPLWPAPEYAQLCVANEWSAFTPRAIPLDELSNALVPMLNEQGALLALFQTPTGRGVTVTPDELVAMLAAEMEHY